MTLCKWCEEKEIGKRNKNFCGADCETKFRSKGPDRLIEFKKEIIAANNIIHALVKQNKSLGRWCIVLASLLTVISIAVLIW